MVRLGRVRNEFEALRAFQRHGSLVLKPCRFRKGWWVWVRVGQSW